MRARPFLVAATAAGLVVCGVGLDHAFAAKSSGPSRSRHVYRFDYVLTVTAPGKAPESTPMTMNVEDGATGEMTAGANIPLANDPAGFASPRQDVGLRLQSAVTTVGSDLLVHLRLEASGADDRAAKSIRKVTSSSDALVTLGKPTLVTVSEEPSTHVRYEVSVTATKLR